MHPKDLNPYYAYLQREVRIARLQRDLAVSQFIHDTLARIAAVLRSVV
ncbi:MAG TPA: hypothetical protein VMG61_03175 [Usitatibacter sp.]|nr:hypothetical protein [Usitatibacter sp.]